MKLAPCIGVLMMTSAPIAPTQTDTREQAERTIYRTSLIRECVAKTEKAMPDQSFASLCGCIADGLMERKTATQLLAEEPTDAEMDAQTDRCLKSHPPTAR